MKQHACADAQYSERWARYFLGQATNSCTDTPLCRQCCGALRGTDLGLLCGAAQYHLSSTSVENDDVLPLTEQFSKGTAICRVSESKLQLDSGYLYQISYQLTAVIPAGAFVRLTPILQGVSYAAYTGVGSGVTPVGSDCNASASGIFLLDTSATCENETLELRYNGTGTIVPSGVLSVLTYALLS